MVVASTSSDYWRQLLGQELVKRKLPYTTEDASLLVALVESGPWDNDSWAMLCARAAMAALESRARDGEQVGELAQRLLVEAGKPHYYDQAAWTRLAARARKLAGSQETIDVSVLQSDDPWSKQVRPVLTERFAGTGGLLAHLGSATQSKPSGRWLKSAEPLLADGGSDLVRFILESSLDAPERETGRFVLDGRQYVTYLWLSDMSSTVVRGALWAASVLPDADWVPPLAERLIARSQQRENIKVGNACFFCLGERADDASVGVLGGIVTRVKDRRFLKPAQQALERAAAKRGLTADELREQLVPTFGLDADGTRRLEIGSASAVVQVVQPANARLRFDVDGRETATAPQALKDDHAEALAALKSEVAELRKELGVQRSRLEGLLATDRVWPTADWREHYLAHPLVQVMARRLIWVVDGVAALPLDDAAYVGLHGAVDPAESEEVRLWHPLDSTPDEIVAWRRLLREREIVQPFKQAYREIYLVAPAELETRVYSNRFAAHIVRYPQVYALAKQRGWGMRALGWFDNDGGEQWRDFPEHSLRASFWMTMADADAHDAGPIANLASTDQVRFSRLGEHDPLPVADIPPRVFSEAMRDVDLFVGVASIAADPTWIDGGADRFTAYWHDHAFGDLGESAQIRREVLAELIPGLKIADRLELEERFLRVRGNLHSYRIHLGSANILIEPHDRYLCIVPDRRPSLGKVFLPFEDDRLSVILSKAFLLAADDKITDRTITRQLDT